jgi:phage terminase small subunit
MIDNDLNSLFDAVLPQVPETTEVAVREQGYGRSKTTDADLFFLQEYIENGGNCVQAALAAGFSETTASTHANDWIRDAREDSQKPDLWDMWIEHRDKRLTALDVTEDRILQEYARLAFFDPSKMFNEEGGFKRIQDMDVDTRMAIKGFDVTDSIQLGRMFKVKFADKRASLADLAQIMGMKREDVQVTHTFQQLMDEIENKTSTEALVSDDNGGDDHVIS